MELLSESFEICEEINKNPIENIYNLNYSNDFISISRHKKEGITFINQIQENINNKKPKNLYHY